MSQNHDQWQCHQWGRADIHEVANHSEVKNVIEDIHSWRFVPPRAPWHGGFYERLIVVLKWCLKKGSVQTSSTVTELNTLLTDVESRVNNKPLSYQTEGINEPEASTSAHLIKTSNISNLLQGRSRINPRTATTPALEWENVDSAQNFVKMAENLKRRVFDSS